MPEMTIRAAILSGLLIFAGTGLASPLEETEEINRMVGSPVPAVQATDVETGKAVALHDVRGNRATVVVFTGIECPIGDLYMPRLVELEATFRDRGVVFLAINANASESAEAGPRPRPQVFDPVPGPEGFSRIAGGRPTSGRADL